MQGRTNRDWWQLMMIDDNRWQSMVIDDPATFWPAVDSSRSVDTGVMAATCVRWWEWWGSSLLMVRKVRMLRLVRKVWWQLPFSTAHSSMSSHSNVSPFNLKAKCFKCLFFQCFPTSTLARKNIQRCRGDLCKNLIFKNLCFQQDKLIVNLQCRAMISTHRRLHIRQNPFKR